MKSKQTRESNRRAMVLRGALALVCMMSLGVGCAQRMPGESTDVATSQNPTTKVPMTKVPTTKVPAAESLVSAETLRSPTVPSITINVTAVEGEVYARTDGDGPWQPLQVGDVYSNTVTIRTLSRSHATIEMGDDQRFTLDRPGLFRLAPPSAEGTVARR